MKIKDRYVGCVVIGPEWNGTTQHTLTKEVPKGLADMLIEIGATNMLEGYEEQPGTSAKGKSGSKPSGDSGSSTQDNAEAE